MRQRYRWGILLVLAWIVVQIVTYYRIGIRFMADSQRYEECLVAFLKTGHFPSGSNFWYHGYTLFLSFAQPWGSGWKGVIFWQVLISGVAIFTLGRAIIRYTGKPQIGAFATAMLIGWLPLSSWNFYVLTESLYTSMVMLSLAALLAIRRPWQLLLAIPLWLFAAWIRPHGLSLLLAVGIFVLIKWGPKWPFARWAWIGGVLSLLLVLLSDRLVHSFHLLEAFYARGELVANYTLVAHQPFRHLLVIPPPEPLVLPDPGNSALSQLFGFIWEYPGFFFKQIFGKLFWFIAHVKPYYSTAHNLFIALTLFPAYGLALRGGKFLNSFKPFHAFSFSFVLINTLAVMFTTEAWDGRFLFPLLPVIFIYAGAGLMNVWQGIVNARTQR